MSMQHASTLIVSPYSKERNTEGRMRSDTYALVPHTCRYDSYQRGLTGAT
jgi:hypothetical protein